MSIELIDKIKPKNNQTFSLVDACDVEMPNGIRLDEAMKTKATTEYPENCLPEIGTLYFLGTMKELLIFLPLNAKLGDMIYIYFLSGDVPTSMTILPEDGYNGLETFATKPNMAYELIGLWNGSKWMLVPHEVM